MSAELSVELADLMEHEKVIEQGLASFLEVGNALLAIKADRKYRAAGYATFEDYCQRRWDISREHGRRLVIAAATTEALVEAMPPTGGILPNAESQVRPLAALPEPERAEAWAEAVDRAGGDQPTAAEVAEVVNERRTPKPVPKPGPKFNGGRSTDAPPHPATFSDAVLDAFRDLLDEHHDADGRRVVDPFAGTGRIHELQSDGWETIGVELEPEWADLHPDTICGDSRLLEDLLHDRCPIDAIATSPAYGNRLADYYDASDPEARRSYAIDLGRALSDGNGAGAQWGDEYRSLHERVWEECTWLLRPGGLLLLNCKDHQRDGRIVPVTGWHVRTLIDRGMAVIDVRTLPAAGLPFTTAKPLSELVIAFRKAHP